MIKPTTPPSTPGLDAIKEKIIRQIGDWWDSFRETFPLDDANKPVILPHASVITGSQTRIPFAFNPFKGKYGTSRVTSRDGRIGRTWDVDPNDPRVRGSRTMPSSRPTRRGANDAL